jgi:hypothetical protein
MTKSTHREQDDVIDNDDFWFACQARPGIEHNGGGGVWWLGGAEVLMMDQ